MRKFSSADEIAQYSNFLQNWITKRIDVVNLWELTQSLMNFSVGVTYTLARNSQRWANKYAPEAPN